MTNSDGVGICHLGTVKKIGAVQRGERLRAARLALKIDQETLAAAATAEGAKMSRSGVSNIENGNDEGSREFYIAVAPELNVSLDYLLLGIGSLDDKLDAKRSGQSGYQIRERDLIGLFRNLSSENQNLIFDLAAKLQPPAARRSNR